MEGQGDVAVFVFVGLSEQSTPERGERVLLVTIGLHCLTIEDSRTFFLAHTVVSLSDLDFTVEMEHRVKKGILYSIHMMVARSLSEWQYVAVMHWQF